MTNFTELANYPVITLRRMSNYRCYTKERSERLRNGNETVSDIKTYRNYTKF